MNEREHSINGVAGRMFAAHRWPDSPLFSTQTWKASREYTEGKDHMRMTVELRFDDNCRNGHQSFAITCDIAEKRGARWHDSGGGAAHDEIAKRFPELAPLIKWHLCATDGPMHYIANTVYHAGERDHNGLRKGESRQIRNGKTGQLAWKLAIVDAAGNEAEKPAQYVDADEKPQTSLRMEYLPWLRVGEGKERQLDYARSSAAWPEATDELLCAEPERLRAMLEARLPGLLAQFRGMMEACGFVWE